MRTDPYVVGEEVRLRSHGRGERLVVVAPQTGIRSEIPAPGGSYTLVLSEPGEWVVQWERGEVEKLRVIKAPERAIDLIDQPPIPKPTHPLSSTPS